jgi:predicted nuclease with TOPRIM domain
VASGVERPDLQALLELEQVLRHLEGELANWRRRALTSEARAAELEAMSDGTAAADRVRSLEEENGTLQQRLDAIRGRVHELLDRLSFLEQQRGTGEADR